MVILAVLLLSGIYFAEILNAGTPVIESGDAGESFAEQKSQEMCSQPGVDAVYVCLGNTVKVIWQEEGRGCTFYEPEGNVVECPLVAPTEMGAECVQLMHPNYCPEVSVCGETPPQEFPGGVEYQDEVEEPGEEPEEAIAPPVGDSEEEQAPAEVEEPVREEPAGPTAEAKETSETAMDNLVGIVLLLGVATIVVLYLMFKRLVRQ